MSKEINYKFYKNGKDVGEITLSKSGFQLKNGILRKRTSKDVIFETKLKQPTHFSINGCSLLKFDIDKFYLYLPIKRKYNRKSKDSEYHKRKLEFDNLMKTKGSYLTSVEYDKQWVNT